MGIQHRYLFSWDIRMPKLRQPQPQPHTALGPSSSSLANPAAPCRLMAAAAAMRVAFENFWRKFFAPQAEPSRQQWHRSQALRFDFCWVNSSHKKLVNYTILGKQIPRALLQTPYKHCAHTKKLAVFKGWFWFRSLGHGNSSINPHYFGETSQNSGSLGLSYHQHMRANNCSPPSAGACADSRCLRCKQPCLLAVPEKLQQSEAHKSMSG